MSMTGFHTQPPPGSSSGAIDGDWQRLPADTSLDRAMSPIAVLVLDGVISTALALGARAAGFGWTSAFLLGWAGGAVLTVGVLAAGYWLSETLKRRRAPVVRQAPVADPGRYDAWDADCAADRAAAARRSRGAA
jgi:hypothetical protein